MKTIHYASLVHILVLLMALCMPALVHGSASIQSFNREFQSLPSEQQEKIKDISRQLRCPTCTGLSILESDAPFSLQMRSAVLAQVKEGKSSDAILTFFTERYGMWILREPPRSGFHMLAWLLPCLLLILGPLVLLYLRYVRPQGSTEPSLQLRSRSAIVAELQDNVRKLRQHVRSH